MAIKRAYSHAKKQAARILLSMLVGWGAAVFPIAKAESLDQPRLRTISAFHLGYSVRHWTIDEGLPSNAVSALAQTPDGYLWVGTNRPITESLSV